MLPSRRWQHMQHCITWPVGTIPISTLFTSTRIWGCFTSQQQMQWRHTDAELKEGDRTYYIWPYGLMTGWRHTMLCHSMTNPDLGQILRRVMAHLFAIGNLLAYFRGDDSAEIWESLAWWVWSTKPVRCCRQNWASRKAAG